MEIKSGKHNEHKKSYLELVKRFEKLRNEPSRKLRDRVNEYDKVVSEISLLRDKVIPGVGSSSKKIELPKGNPRSRMRTFLKHLVQKKLSNQKRTPPARIR